MPTVLGCELDLEEVRRQLGGKGVIHRKGIIAIDGPVPIEMMHSLSLGDFATVPAEIAAWVNSLLDLGPQAAVQPKHPGLMRLSRWINARLASGGGLVSSELIDRAGRWPPEFFKGAALGGRRLRRHRRVGFIVTNLPWRNKRVVRFYNQRGTPEQWIKEGKNAVK